MVRPDVNFRNPTVQCERCINEKGSKTRELRGKTDAEISTGNAGHMVWRETEIQEIFER